MPDQSAPKVAHLVFFTLKESSGESRQALVASCEEYLTGHAGVEHFSVGIRGDDFTRPANDQEFDVGLHVIFDSRAAHDAYQVDPRHVEFIERNKDSWKSVRIFDSYV